MIFEAHKILFKSFREEMQAWHFFHLLNLEKS